MKQEPLEPKKLQMTQDALMFYWSLFSFLSMKELLIQVEVLLGQEKIENALVDRAGQKTLKRDFIAEYVNTLQGT